MVNPRRKRWYNLSSVHLTNLQNSINQIQFNVLLKIQFWRSFRPGQFVYYVVLCNFKMRDFLEKLQIGLFDCGSSPLKSTLIFQRTSRTKAALERHVEADNRLSLSKTK